MLKHLLHVMLETLRRGRLRWFCHVELKVNDDWGSAFRNIEVMMVEVNQRKTGKRRPEKDFD